MGGAVTEWGLQGNASLALLAAAATRPGGDPLFGVLPATLTHARWPAQPRYAKRVAVQTAADSWTNVSRLDGFFQWTNVQTSQNHNPGNRLAGTLVADHGAAEPCRPVASGSYNSSQWLLLGFDEKVHRMTAPLWSRFLGGGLPHPPAPRPVPPRPALPWPTRRPARCNAS